MTNNSLVVFRGISKSFNGVSAVSDISLSLQRGEFVAVMGPSGCGKTTLIKILAGFEKPDAGEIEMNGKSINHLPPWQRNMPMVWQSLALFPFLCVLENVEFGLKMRGMVTAERRRKCLHWLEKLEIGDLAARSVATLSGGQRQRVALARTLVLEPEILLLDEPLSALDANMVVHMQGVLSRLQKKVNITFLYVTHSRSEAFSMADRVVVMNRGRILQIGDPREIYHTPKDRFVAGFIGANNIFSGHSAGCHNGYLRIKTPEGIFNAPIPASPPPVDTPMEFVVAAADTEISLTNNDGVACQLDGEEFIGGFVMLHLKTNSGMMLMSQIHADKLRQLGNLREKTIYLRWPAEKLHILVARERDEI